MARRLSELSLVTAAFSSGELSYSKVRAITRVATEANEGMLVDLARAMTASHLERVVRCYRLAGADPENDTDPVDHYRNRFLSTQWNDDGSLTIRAKLPPAEGAMVIEALRRAADSLHRDRQRRPRSRSANADDVSAETSNEGGDDVSADTSDEDWAAWDLPEGDGLATDVSAETFGSETEPRDADEESPAPWDGWGAAQADALRWRWPRRWSPTACALAAAPAVTWSLFIPTPTPRTGQADRTAAYLDNGPRVAAETVRRLMCDSSLAFALQGPDGTVINLSPRAPSIPTALVRAVKLRDGGCVFPGCTRSAFVDVHHIRHRADGGANSAANCCTCAGSTTA